MTSEPSTRSSLDRQATMGSTVPIKTTAPVATVHKSSTLQAQPQLHQGSGEATWSFRRAPATSFADPAPRSHNKSPPFDMEREVTTAAAFPSPDSRLPIEGMSQPSQPHLFA